MELNKLERALLEKFLEDPSRKPVRELLQWNLINVKRRAMSQVGFLTEFEPSQELKLFDDETSLRWGEVGARLNAAGIETGYLVYVDGGQVTALEGYTYGGEEWPSQVDAVEWYVLKEGMELKSRPR